MEREAQLGGIELEVVPAVAIRPAPSQTHTIAARSLWGDVGRRLLADRLALASALLLLAVALLAIAAPVVAPKGYAAQDYQNLRVAPNTTYWLGTDAAGRDMWARIVYGARISLAVGLGVQLVAVLVGVPLGLLAGFLGGRVDMVIMRAVDILYAFPTLLFAILLMSWLGQGVMNIILALSLVGWLQMCRLVRGQVLSLREREFILAAQALGVPTWRILAAHLLPNTLATIITTVTFGIPQAILAEASLSFIGVGINPPLPSWGSMVSDNILAIRSAWHLALFPAVALGLTMLAFTAFGDGLRDALDPRSQRRG
jgi:ABC-type dipeptide/oligopeptide/nickel transport system permease subunit